MFYRFQYEAEFYPTLSRVLLHVRMKLDLTGIKLSLKDWLAFSMEERMVLCHLPVESDEEKQAFSGYLNFLRQKYRGVPAEMAPPVSASLWDSASEIPAPVMERSAAHGAAITLQEWNGWQSHHRYALYKTAVSKNEPEKFDAVLKELRER